MIKKYTINIFGTGNHVFICQIPNMIFDKMAIKVLTNQFTWEELLFDFDIVQNFGVSSWKEWSVDSFMQIPLCPKNVFELKLANKNIVKFKMSELNTQNTLFPLYNTKYRNFEVLKIEGYTSIIVKQEEKGLLAKYELITDEMNIDHFYFKLVNDKNNASDSLSKIRYKNHHLIHKTNDTVICGLHVLVEINKVYFV